MAMSDEEEKDKQPMSADFYTEETLSAYIGVSTTAIRTWRRLGKGPKFIKLSRLVRYRATDVEAWLRKQTMGRG